MNNPMKWIDSRRRKPAVAGWYWIAPCGKNPSAGGWSEVKHPSGKMECVGPKHIGPDRISFYLWCGPVAPPPDLPEDEGSLRFHPKFDGDLSDSIEALDLSVRATNALDAEGIQTIKDLISRTEPELRQMKNMGLTSVREIQQKLGGVGLSLKASPA